MRRFPVLCLLLLAVTSVLAQAPERIKEPPQRPGPALQVGDVAPPPPPGEALHGTPGKTFTPGQVHVVEFWATWAEPSVALLGRSAELQAEYRDKVTFLGVTSADPDSPRAQVQAFLAPRGTKFGHAFTLVAGPADAWLKASGRTALPTAFIIDRAGKVAFIGHTLHLGAVLPRVVAGTWTPEEAASLPQVETEVTALLKGLPLAGAESAHKALVEFEAKHPALAKLPALLGPRLAVLLRNKKFADAKRAGEAALTTAARFGDTTSLRTLALALTGVAQKDSQELLDLAVKAAVAEVQVTGENDALALLNLAEAQAAAGQVERAKETGAKARAAAVRAPEVTALFIDRQVKKIEEKKRP